MAKQTDTLLRSGLHVERVFECFLFAVIAGTAAVVAGCGWWALQDSNL